MPDYVTTPFGQEKFERSFNVVERLIALTLRVEAIEQRMIVSNPQAKLLSSVQKYAEQLGVSLEVILSGSHRVAKQRRIIYAKLYAEGWSRKDIARVLGVMTRYAEDTPKPRAMRNLPTK